MGYQCGKCGFNEAKVQLREVLVTVGWSASQIKTPAPCLMCLQCGDLTCHIDIQMGKFLNLIPGPTPTPPGERTEVKDPKVVPIVAPKASEAEPKLQSAE